MKVISKSVTRGVAVAFSLCSPGALGLKHFEGEESLMDEGFEQASACLK
jgi:hypothetical protein